uniref:DNA 3'-5' helicase n=1 Tax=Amphimedon queenslandica TaxID=400682 RepID=A0A1X7U5D2_AMPQE
MKDKTLASFCDAHGKLCIALATTAFGMGVDCRELHVIYHWRAPSNLEQYPQETGQARRDTFPSRAVLEI